MNPTQGRAARPGGHDGAGTGQRGQVGRPSRAATAAALRSLASRVERGEPAAFDAAAAADELLAVLAGLDDELWRNLLATADHTTAARMVSVGQAAELLGVSVDTVRRRIAEGQIEGVRLGYRTMRVPLVSLALFVAARQRSGHRA